MPQCNKATDQPSAREQRRFSPRASLAGVGQHVQRHKLFGPIRQRVTIDQKTVKHTPLDKLYDAFIAILAGAQGMVEINKRLRSDPALQAAFGRRACAEQSVVQDTLDACTLENTAQMEQALTQIYRRHSGGYRHGYRRAWQILDVDMSGQPCGKRAELATKGYFAKQRNRRGRQVGRVTATRYGEIVVDRLFAGTTQLAAALVPLVEAAEATLELDEKRRRRTILRVDAGGGSLADVNWALARGYAVHCKDYSGSRAQVLMQSVTQWIEDPRLPGRQVGWVDLPAPEYVRPVRRLVVRCRKANGQWGVGVLISALEAEDVLQLTGQSPHRRRDAQAVLLAYVYFYDQRGGGIETSFKEDKQGLGLGQRNKKRFAAQMMLTQLGVLAHNVLVWVRATLAQTRPQWRRYGIKRLVRDVLSVSGVLVFDPANRMTQLILNRADPLARALVAGLLALLEPQQVDISLGEI